MKKIFLFILSIIIVVGIVVGVTLAADADNSNVKSTVSEAYIPSEKTNNVDIDLKALMNEQAQIQEEAHNRAEELRAAGYSEDSPEIIEVKETYMEANGRYNEVLAEYIGTDEFWEEKYAENPTGTYIWRYLKDLGYSDAVCAGIFGNMMLECGIEEVGSFDLKWWMYDSSYAFYGLCQWSRTYFPEVYGADLDGQLNCLLDTIKEQIDEAGFVYGGQGFGYEQFLQLTDPAEVAVCFAQAYERCPSQHVWPRRGFAEQAYNYFTN